MPVGRNLSGLNQLERYDPQAASTAICGRDKEWPVLAALPTRELLDEPVTQSYDRLDLPPRDPEFSSKTPDVHVD